MGYAFTRGDDVAASTRKIVGDQIDKALKDIEGGTDLDETVHQLRKACKKIRGVLRLVRPNFKTYDEENEAFRALGGDLSGARDAGVMVETFAGLLEPIDAVPDALASAFDDLQERLLARATHVRQQLDEDTMLASARDRFEEARLRVKDWKFEEKGIDILLPGLEQVYRRFRKRLAIAHAESSPETTHEFRKAAKYHWYHVRLLQKAAPAMLDPRAAALDRLGKLLGDHQNLAVLGDWVDSATVGNEALHRFSAEAIGQRQETLLDKAFDLADQLAAEKPGALSKRFSRYWALMES